MLSPGSLIAKFAALAILAFVLLAAHHFIAGLLFETYRDNQARIEHANGLLQRYQNLVAEKPQLAKRLASLESTVETSDAYLDGGNDALAAAALQELVMDTIDIAGGQVMSSRSLPFLDLEDGPELRRMGVQLRFKADIDSLAETLQEMETMEPRLIIDRLEIAAAQARRTNGNVDIAPKLDVRLDVYGYARSQS